MMLPNKPMQPTSAAAALAADGQRRWADVTSPPAMEKLLVALISAWCWLRVAASPTLIGAALGVGAYYLIGGTSGLVAGGLLALLGLYFGLRLANYARRKGQLVEFAHGLPPSKSTPIDGGSDRDG